MLIDFTIRNFLSFKNETTFSMVRDKKIKDNTLYSIPIEKGRYNLYSFSGIYGPNASGKSNMIKALLNLVSFVELSHRLDLDDPIPSYKPFLLDKESKTLPCYFSIEFVVEEIRYLYEIEFIQKTILREELFFFPEGRKAILFVRNKNDELKFGTYFKGEKKFLKGFLLPNRLLLSVAANSTNEQLDPIFRFFRDVISIYVKTDSFQISPHNTTLKLKNRGNDFRKKLFNFLKAADLSLSNIRIIEDEGVVKKIQLPENFPKMLKEEIINELKYKTLIGHKIFENGIETNEQHYFDLINEESTGTIKMYAIAGEIINTLLNGGVLVMDEFNSELHPLLNQFIVSLFVDRDINKKNAQLIISTHDTCVLDMEVLDAEQFWFTKKYQDNHSELYSLNEFDRKEIKKISKYGRYYLEGRFSAVPATSLKFLLEGFINA